MLILSLFSMNNIKSKENRLKIDIIHHMGKFVKIWNWKVTFLKSILSLRNYGMDFQFFGK